MAMMEGSDSVQRLICCRGKAVRDTLEGMEVGGCSVRGAGGDSAMNGSSVLGLENRKMSIVDVPVNEEGSILEEDVLKVLHVPEHAVSDSSYQHVGKEDFAVKGTERKMRKNGGARFEANEVLVEVVHSLLFLESESDFSSVENLDFDGGRHKDE